MPERKAELKYSFRQYTVYANRIGAGIPEKEIKKEYTRLRDILNKRIQRINKSDFAGQGIAGKFPQGLPKLAEIAPEDLPYLLQQAATALNSRGGSLKGLQMRQSETVQSLRERGYTNIDESNIRQFARFMEESRDRGLEKIYGSDAIAEMYDSLVAIGVSPESVMTDFKWWLDNIDKAEKSVSEHRERGENVTSEAIRNEFKW